MKLETNRIYFTASLHIRTIILPAILCGSETWSHTKEHILRAFENTVLRRIFGPKREEVAGGWTRLHNEELHNLYTSPNIIRVITARVEWAGHVTCMGRMRNAYLTFG
jgi:hypothetical protein